MFIVHYYGRKNVRQADEFHTENRQYVLCYASFLAKDGYAIVEDTVNGGKWYIDKSTCERIG